MSREEELLDDAIEGVEATLSELTMAWRQLLGAEDARGPGGQVAETLLLAHRALERVLGDLEELRRLREVGPLGRRGEEGR
ncbi:MAG: hypothetical protein RQ985_08870 [Dehalococcoidia bacterium]|jgi:hypothetical protein|nr:hypothetical protein [Dehalococcoidia bacterium]